MKTLSVKITDEIDARVDALARSKSVTRSDIVRAALEAYTGASKGSVLDLAGDLVGSLRGPSDLSHNPRHLDGYGE